MESVLARIKHAKIMSSKKGDPLWMRSAYMDAQGDLYAGNPDLIVKFFGVCPPGEPRNVDVKGDQLDTVDPTAAVYYTEAANTLNATSLMMRGRFDTTQLKKAISVCKSASPVPPMFYQSGGRTSLNLKDEGQALRLSIGLENRESPSSPGKEFFTYLDTGVMESFLELMDEEEVAIRFFETPLPYFGGCKNVRVLFSYAHSHPNFLGA